MTTNDGPSGHPHGAPCATKRRFRWTGAALALTTLLSACGGGGGGVAPAPPPPPAASGFGVGGTVSGLAEGARVVLNSGSRSITVSANGPFTLASDFAAASTYDLHAQHSAAESRCSVSGGRGTVVANVTQIAVDCGLGAAWVTNEPVLASALSPDGRTLFIGGSFSRVARPSGSFVRTDPASGILLDVPQLVIADVLNATADGEGGAYLTTRLRELRPGASRATQHAVRRIDAAGALTSFSASGWSAAYSSAPGVVPFALLRSGSMLFASGSFVLPGSAEAQGLAALDAQTGALLSWRAGIALAAGPMALAGDTLFVARQVVLASGVVEVSLAAVDVASGSVRAWAPVFTTSGMSLYDVRLAVSGRTLVVSGPFTAVDGVPRRGLAAFDIATLALRSWDPAGHDTNGILGVSALAATADTVYVGGSFNRIGNANRTNLAALSTATGDAVAWQAPVVDGALAALAVHGDALVLTGNFETVGAEQRRGLAALSLADGSLRSYAAGQDFDWPTHVVSSGSRLWIGGSFTLAGGVRRNGIAAIDTRTGQALDWSPDLRVRPAETRQVRHLALLPGGLLAVGSFDVPGTPARRDVISLDTTTAQPLAWDAQINTAPDIRQIVVEGASVYVVGGFTSWAGQPRSGVARLDAGTLALQPFALGMGGNVFSPTRLAVGNGKLFVAGGSNAAAAFDAQTGARLSWTPQVTSPFTTEVKDLLSVGDAVYMVGTNLLVPGNSRLVTSVRVDAVTGASAEWLSVSDNYLRLFLLDGRLLATRCETDVFSITNCTLNEKSLQTGGDLGQMLSTDAAIETVQMDALTFYAGGRFGGDGVSRQGLWFLGR